jgi:rare lipoprotein A
MIPAMVIGAVLLVTSSTGSDGLLPVQSDAAEAAQSGPGSEAASDAASGEEADIEPYRETGAATWYGEQFHGRLTANGEQYDMFQLTAAHLTIPMGSLVRVTHARSGRSVVVRINDRGPWTPHAVLDLSYAAAEQLKMVKQGRALVRLEVVKPGGRHRLAPSAAVDAADD